MVDGIPVSKAFRHREIMLLQAVVEKYGKVNDQPIEFWIDLISVDF